MITESQVEEAIKWLATSAERRALERATKVYLDKFDKTLKAELEAESGEKTEGARSRYALKHEKYREHLEGFMEAVRRDALNTFQAEAMMAKLDAWRTECANNRGAESIR